MNFWIRLFSLLLVPSFCFATPVTYVYFGQKWADHFHEEYTEEDRAAFMMGVVFPDIRYLNIKMPREPNASDITKSLVLDEENPFEQGRLFHYFFLNFRDSVVEELSLFDKLTNAPEDNRDLLLMLLEDHNYFDEIDRNGVKSYFQNVIEDEEYTGVPYHTLRTWHRIVTQYYGMSAFAIVRRLRQFDFGMFGASKETVAEWAREFPALLESDAFQVYVADLEAGFEQFLD